MKQKVEWATTGVALTLMGVLAGCGANNVTASTLMNNSVATNATTPTSPSSQQTVYVFSRAMLEEIYAVKYFGQIGPIIPPQNIQNKVDQWAPKVSMNMLPYAPAGEQELDKQLIQNIEGPTMTLLKSLPGYTLHQDQLPSGTRTYWYPSNNKFPIWVDPVVR